MHRSYRTSNIDESQQEKNEEAAGGGGGGGDVEAVGKSLSLASPMVIERMRANYYYYYCYYQAPLLVDGFAS